jgi:hypothetical protein
MRHAFRGLEEWTRMFSGVTPETSGPGEVVVPVVDGVGERLPNRERGVVFELDLLAAAKMNGGDMVPSADEFQRSLESRNDRVGQPFDRSRLPGWGRAELVHDRRGTGEGR